MGARRPSRRPRDALSLRAPSCPGGHGERHDDRSQQPEEHRDPAPTPRDPERAVVLLARHGGLRLLWLLPALTKKVLCPAGAGALALIHQQDSTNSSERALVCHLEFVRLRLVHGEAEDGQARERGHVLQRDRGLAPSEDEGVGLGGQEGHELEQRALANFAWISTGTLLASIAAPHSKHPSFNQKKLKSQVNFLIETCLINSSVYIYR